MFDQEDGDAPLVAQPVHQFHHAFRLPGIHARGRFVEQEQARAAAQGTRHLKQALVAVRQVGSNDLVFTAQADEIQQLSTRVAGGALFSLLTGCTQDGAPVGCA